MANKNSIKISGIRRRTHDNVDKMMDKVESIKENAGEKIATLKERAGIIEENFDGYIRKNPEKSVLIAAGIGAAAGAILIAAMMRKR